MPLPKNKTYIVTFRSRYYPFEGTRKRRVVAPNKKWIRTNWHAIMDTDEYSVVRCDEVKE